MKKPCENWRDQLLEAALAGATAKGLEEHLRTCTNCSVELTELRARKARLDALLPLAAQGAGPSTDFRARVLAAAEAAGDGKRAQPWRGWSLAGGTAGIPPPPLMGDASYPRTPQTNPRPHHAPPPTP